jgi:hypothetical protein
MFNAFKKKEIISGLRTYDFYKEKDVTQLQGIPFLENFGPKKDRWYIDLPEWKGPKANLEMVAGADDLLDFLSRGVDRVNVTFADEKIDNGFALKHIGGGVYEVDMATDADISKAPTSIWLCDVTRFIFEGVYPDTIYFRVDEDRIREDLRAKLTAKLAKS